MCVYMCSKRETDRRRELHSVVLVFQSTLAKVGWPDKKIFAGQMWPVGRGLPTPGLNSIFSVASIIF